MKWFYIVRCYQKGYTNSGEPMAYFESETKANKFRDQIQKEADSYHWSNDYKVEKQIFSD